MATFVEIAIPFFFILAVVYGSLEVSNVFKKSSVKGMISLAIAAVTLTSEAVTDFVYEILPYAAILFVIFFILGFILNVFKGEDRKVDFSLVAVIAALVLVFVSTQQEFIESYVPWLSSENSVFIVAGILLLMIFYAAYKKGGFMGDAQQQ
jgi:hypothetical protein